MPRRGPAASDRPSRRIPPAAVFVLVGLATLCVFLPSIRNGFVDWDDDKNFLNNLAYRGLGVEQLKWMWTTFHLGPYQPLSWMTLGLDYVLWGMRPAGYHLTSALLHALAAALFGFVAAKLLEQAGARPREALPAPAAGGRAARGKAVARPEAPGGIPWDSAAFGALAALLWAVHPLRVEAVSWITERREVLCGALSMLALALHLAGRRRVLVIVAACAAMLAKGTAVVLPFLLVLIDAHAGAGPRLAEWPAALLRSVKRWALVFCAALVVGVLAIVGQRQAEAAASLASVGFLDRAALYGHGLGFYALKTLWPQGLAPLYEMHADLSRVRASGAVGLALFAAAFVLAVRLRARAPAAAPVLLAYAGLLAPVGGILQVGFQLAADRYAYAAGWALSLGAALAIAALAHAALRRRGGAAGDGLAPILAAAALVLATPLAILTVRQQAIWKDAESLWTHQLDVRPDTALAHYSVANLRVTRDRGRDADLWAEPHFREAIRLRPDKPEAYRGLGNVLRRTGRLDEAIRVYKDGLAQAPHHGPLVYGLATAQWQLGDHAAAIDTLRRLADCPPVTADSFIVLARALAAAGRPQEAAVEYERAMTAPSDTPAVAPMELAWLLATHPDPRFRNGPRALALARRAAESGRELAARGGLALKSGLQARLARTLAAALAETGEFETAAGVLRDAASAFPPEQRAGVDEMLAGFASRRPARAEPTFP